MSGVLGLCLLAGGAMAQVSVSITLAPPLLPLYDQPVVPGEGYIWTPGYWRWSAQEDSYYWVPGTWVLPPSAGDLWTPGYWAFQGVGYIWHIGYWGRQVGYYGGLNYGHGYTGIGYQGGRWERGVFRYNRSASNVGRGQGRDIYRAPIVNNRPPDGISFNGGRAGTPARPTPGERRFQGAVHRQPSDDQVQHENRAIAMPTQRANGPHGVPQVAATPRPRDYEGPGVERVRPVPPGQQRQERPQQHAPQRGSSGRDEPPGRGR